jgi:hypothetical protein
MAPNSTAAPPSSNSRLSWSPAVPPPPAAGGPEGTGVGDVVVAVAVGLAVGGVVKTVGDAVPVALWLGLVVGLVLVPVLGPVVELAGAVAVPVAVPVTVGEPPAVGEPDIEGMVGVEVEPPEHAARAIEAMTVSAPAAISLALSVNPAMVVRSLMNPPQAPYAVFRFLVPASQTRTVRNNTRRNSALAEGRFPKAATIAKVRPGRGTDVQ